MDFYVDLGLYFFYFVIYWYGNKYFVDMCVVEKSFN